VHVCVHHIAYAYTHVYTRSINVHTCGYKNGARKDAMYTLFFIRIFACIYTRTSMCSHIRTLLSKNTHVHLSQLSQNTHTYLHANRHIFELTLKSGPRDFLPSSLRFGHLSGAAETASPYALCAYILTCQDGEEVRMSLCLCVCTHASVSYANGIITPVF
jgi:hypothetical protein